MPPSYWLLWIEVPLGMGALLLLHLAIFYSPDADEPAGLRRIVQRADSRALKHIVIESALATAAVLGAKLFGSGTGEALIVGAMGSGAIWLVCLALEANLAIIEHTRPMLLRRRLAALANAHSEVDIEFLRENERPLVDTLSSAFAQAGWAIHPHPFATRSYHPSVPSFSGIKVSGADQQRLVSVADALRRFGLRQIVTDLHTPAFGAENVKWPTTLNRVYLKIGHLSAAEEC